MKKIENIIDSCNQCKHCKAMVSEKSNSFYAAICNYQSEFDEEKEVPPMVLHTSTDSSKNYCLDIPDNCPLETYSENETRT
jgi:hypothetical protein